MGPPASSTPDVLATTRGISSENTESMPPVQSEHYSAKPRVMDRVILNTTAVYLALDPLSISHTFGSRCMQSRFSCRVLGDKRLR